MSHITLTSSQNLFRELFKSIRDKFEIIIDPTKDPNKYTNVHRIGKSSLTTTVKGKVKLENGEIDFVEPNRIRIRELDVVFEQLDISFVLDIQKICVGGECLFQSDRDIVTEVNLVPLFNRIEVSFDLILSEKHIKGDQNYWVVTGEPDLPDIDIDVADTIGDLISKKLAQAIKDTIPGNSTLEKSIVQTIENIGEFTRDLLDLPDDLQEWIQQTLLDEFGLINIIMGAILDYFKNKLTAKFQFEDPYEIMKKTKFRLCDFNEIDLNPVKVPIVNFHVEVIDTNLVVKADIGSKKK